MKIHGFKTSFWIKMIYYQTNQKNLLTKNAYNNKIRHACKDQENFDLIQEEPEQFL